MADYQKIMALVEEVKDILDLTEKAKLSPERKALNKHIKKVRKHNPFKNVKKDKSIGFGPGLEVGPRKVKKAAEWSCHCGSKYKCLCLGADGSEKKVNIDKSYKQRYNTAYRKHRAMHPSQYAVGKGSVFKRAAKAE